MLRWEQTMHRPQASPWYTWGESSTCRLCDWPVKWVLQQPPFLILIKMCIINWSEVPRLHIQQTIKDSLSWTICGIHILSMYLSELSFIHTSIKTNLFRFCEAMYKHGHAIWRSKWLYTTVSLDCSHSLSKASWQALASADFRECLSVTV